MYMAIGAVLVLGGCASLAYAYQNKQELLYYLYSRTFVGRMIHASSLDKARASVVPGQSAARLSRREYNVETKGAHVRIVPYLSDNYAYIITCKATRTSAVVDPADPLAVIEGLHSLEKDLGGRIHVTTILTTHYHADHAGGNTDFVALTKEKRFCEGREMVVVGGAKEKAPSVQGATLLVKHGDEIRVGELVFECLEVPCHTWGSLLFICREENLCFTGDFIFSAGAGKFFEGGARDFAESVARSVDPLEDDVLLFPGHEYTVSNLNFALKVMPNDVEIQARLKEAMELRSEDAPTIPSPLGHERQYNLFLRCLKPEADPELAVRINELVLRGTLKVSAGADRRQKETTRVRLSPEPTGEELVKALRALKDKGI